MGEYKLTVSVEVLDALVREWLKIQQEMWYDLLNEDGYRHPEDERKYQIRLLASNVLLDFLRG